VSYERSNISIFTALRDFSKCLREKYHYINLRPTTNILRGSLAAGDYILTSLPCYKRSRHSLISVHSLTSVSSASFNTSVQCDAKLAEIAFSGFLGSDEDLESICTTQCLTSLQKFRNQQKAACSPSDVITAGGLPYPATFGADQLLLSYNITCKRDP